MKNVARISAARRRSRMCGSASTTPKRPWDSATGSWTPRAIQSVSASRSKVKAQAARASAGQWGGREEVTESVIGDFILAQGETPHQTAAGRGRRRAVVAGGNRDRLSVV